MQPGRYIPISPFRAASATEHRILHPRCRKACAAIATRCQLESFLPNHRCVAYAGRRPVTSIVGFLSSVSRSRHLNSPSSIIFLNAPCPASGNLWIPAATKSTDHSAVDRQRHAAKCRHHIGKRTSHRGHARAVGDGFMEHRGGAVVERCSLRFLSRHVDARTLRAVERFQLDQVAGIIHSGQGAQTFRCVPGELTRSLRSGRRKSFGYRQRLRSIAHGPHQDTA